MSSPLAGFDFDPTIRAAIDRAAASDGLSPPDWLTLVVTQHLRRRGFLPALEDDGMRPEQLNAGNDG